MFHTHKLVLPPIGNNCRQLPDSYFRSERVVRKNFEFIITHFPYIFHCKQHHHQLYSTWPWHVCSGQVIFRQSLLVPSLGRLPHLSHIRVVSIGHQVAASFPFDASPQARRATRPVPIMIGSMPPIWCHGDVFCDLGS
jgi:hypothetical protein